MCALGTIGLLAPAFAQTQDVVLAVNVLPSGEVRIQNSKMDEAYSIETPLPGFALRIVLTNARLSPSLPASFALHGSTISSVQFSSRREDEIVDVATIGWSKLLVERVGKILVLRAASERRSDASNSSDTAVPASSLVRRVVRLKYADAAEVANALVANSILPSNDLLPLVPSGISGGASAVGGLPQQTNLSQSISPEMPPAQRVSDAISIDRRLNAVVLSGTIADVVAMEDLISQLDVAVPIVMIEAEVVELTDQAAKDLGIEYSPNGAAATGTLTVESSSKPSAAGTLQAALYAEVQSGNGRVLARPRIATQSSVAAYIQTGDAIPYLTSITYPGATAVTQQQVQYVNAGVTLSVLPRVGSGGDITVKVSAVVSSVTSYVQTAPEISQRSATAIATVGDGQTLILGGLIQEVQTTSTTHVPFLGNLPLIGGLFRADHTSVQRDNLYIAITPHIVQSKSAQP